MSNTSKAPANFTIIQAKTEQEIDVVRMLFQTYQKELGKDLTFQSFETELRDLPKGYEAPSGSLLLLRDLDDQEFVGCVAVKKLAGKKCEMKRLYVKPSHRVKKYGQKLAVAILEEAKALGYEEMWLDTLEELVPAVRLYEKLGFQETEAYYDNPHEGVVYMSKVL